MLRSVLLLHICVAALAAQQPGLPGHLLPSHVNGTTSTTSAFSRQQHDPIPGTAKAATLSVPESAFTDLLVPVHTLPADAVSGEYGWWAAGNTYKCSFHGGFTFYPYLGPDYPENLPLAWRNTRIAVGGHALLASPASVSHVHTDFRYEYRYAGITEAYEVRKGGVEQTPGDRVQGRRRQPLRRLRCRGRD